MTYIYDSYGGLEQVLMPRGTRYGFWRQNGFGVTKVGYQLPGYSEPYVTHWDLSGRLVLVRPPGGDGVVATTYQGDGRVSMVVAGDRRYDWLTGVGVLSPHNPCCRHNAGWLYRSRYHPPIISVKASLSRH